jgi:hypothetical protein
MAKMGRPTKYNKELADKICRLRREGKSMRAIARMSGMPDVHTLCRWKQKHDYFRAQYAQAWVDYLEMEGDNIIEMADKATSKNFMPQRVKIDTRKWVLSKQLPVAYGEVLRHEGKVDHGVNITFSSSDKEL